jgi:hypothetical protein
MKKFLCVPVSGLCLFAALSFNAMGADNERVWPSGVQVLGVAVEIRANTSITSFYLPGNIIICLHDAAVNPYQQMLANVLNDAYRYGKKIYYFRSTGPVQVRSQPNFYGVVDECTSFDVLAGEPVFLKAGS